MDTLKWRGLPGRGHRQVALAVRSYLPRLAGQVKRQKYLRFRGKKLREVVLGIMWEA